MTPSLLLVPFLLVSAQEAGTPRFPREPGPGELVEGEVGFLMDEFLTRLEGVGFSGIVGVEHEGEPVLVKGYGLAERESGRRVTPETVFTVGSITKQFTAAAILVLQDQGKLSVQDPLTRFFADVPEDRRGLTLHHLLTHTSGLQDPPAGDFDVRATEEWITAWAFESPLEWQPGARFGYRNVNFSLLGMVVARVSGEPYEAFLRRHLFEPAGMQRTGYLLPGFAPEDLAVGYKAGDRWGTVLERPMLADGPCWTLRANGGIHSTVGDMLRWHHALLADRVLSAEARTQLETPWAPEGGGSSYGYGWSIAQSPGGKKLVAHNGGNTVFFADFLRAVEEGDCVYVATNVGSRVRQSLAYELLGMLHGRRARAVPETLACDRDFLDRYVGRYSLGEGSSLAVRNGADRLLLTGSGPDALELLVEPRARARIDEVRAIAAAVCAGEDQALLDVYGGFQTEESVRAELGEARARWKTSLGAYQGLGEAALRLPGDEQNVLVEARFERGSAWLRTSWGPAGRVFGFECLDEAPFVGLPTTELFPASATAFQAYDDRSGAGLEIGFECDDSGQATALVLPAEGLTIPRE